MQPPTGAGEPIDPAMTWTSRVWFARNSIGGQTREPSSLSQMSRAFRQGVLSPDVEVAIDGEWVWENVRHVLARYASLAPPNAHDLRESGRMSDGFPELELTLTGQMDPPPPPGPTSRSEDLTVPAPGPPVVVSPVGPLPPRTLPPPPPLPPPAPLPSFDDRPARTVPTVPPAGPRSMPANVGSESLLDVPIPPRLPNLVFLSSSAVAAIVLLAGGGIGIESCNDRLVDAIDARTTLIAVLVGLAWLIAGAVVAITIALLGRAAAGVLLIVRKMDEGPRR
jgi:hypothetical protein